MGVCVSLYEYGCMFKKKKQRNKTKKAGKKGEEKENEIAKWEKENADCVEICRKKEWYHKSWMKDIFSFFLFILIFSDYFSFFSYIFDVTVLTVILLFNPIQDFSFIKSSFSLFIMFFLIRYSYHFLYYCLCLVLFNSFSHWSLQTFLFHSFEILFCCDIRSLFLFLSTFSAFSISQSCYFVVFFFHYFKTCSHSHFYSIL